MIYNTQRKTLKWANLDEIKISNCTCSKRCLQDSLKTLLKLCTFAQKKKFFANFIALFYNDNVDGKFLLDDFASYAHIRLLYIYLMGIQAQFCLHMTLAILSWHLSFKKKKFLFWEKVTVEKLLLLRCF